MSAPTRRTTHYYGDGCDGDHGRADHPLANSLTEADRLTTECARATHHIRDLFAALREQVAAWTLPTYPKEQA